MSEKQYCVERLILVHVIVHATSDLVSHEILVLQSSVYLVRVLVSR